MTSPHLAPIGDRLRLAIGDSVIAATQLEFQIVCLVAIARNESDEWVRKTLTIAGAARRTLRALAEEVDQSGFRVELDRLATDVEAVLNARNAIVHSVVLVDHMDDGLVATFWHPKSDEERRPKVDELNEQVGRMNALAARTLQLGHAADDWRKAHAAGAPTA